MRRVAITAVGLFAPPGDATGRGAHALADFLPREHLPDKKHAKLMSRGVQLGIASLKRALDRRAGWQSVDPERRALFVGTSPGGGDADDLIPAMEASRIDDRFDVAAFGERGIPLVPPLWLVRGLSNNVVGYGSAYFEIRGANATRCDGRHAGLAAVIDGIRCVAEGRADLAAAGASDCLTWAADVFPLGVAEAGAFVVIEPADREAAVTGEMGYAPGAPIAFPTIEYGATTGLVDLARRVLAGESGFTVESRDPGGGFARVTVGNPP